MYHIIIVYNMYIIPYAGRLPVYGFILFPIDFRDSKSEKV